MCILSAVHKQGCLPETGFFMVSWGMTHRPCNSCARNRRIREDVGAAQALPGRLPPGITKLQHDRMKVARVEKCELLSKNDCSCPPHVWLGAAVATGLKLHIRAKQSEGKYAGSVHTPETHKT